MIESFTTERTSAERMRSSDLDDFLRMSGDARVMATLGGMKPDGWTRAFVEQGAEHWERHGFGLWVFRDRADGRWIGRCGLRHVDVEGVDEVEVGYALMPDWWGRGLATEIAAAALAVGFGELGLPDVVSFTLPTNLASRRVMEKCGLTFERDIVYADLPHVLYRETAEEWKAREAGEVSPAGR